MSKVITSKNELSFKAEDLDPMPVPNKILMVKPEHFSVDYVINPHMEGNVGTVDKKLAMEQWEAVRAAFEKTVDEVVVLDGVEGLPDMVFCANQSLPYMNRQNGKEVVMSIMNSDMRKAEVPHIEEWYTSAGYEIHHLNYKKISDFEGMGDAIWHYGKRLLWGGYGFRSSMKAYEFIAETWNVPVIALKLENPSFYHLDTCFCILNEDSVLIYPEAFTKKGLALIESMFTNIIEADKHEAEELFACNATCPDGKNVVIQRGCKKVNTKLTEAGFTVHEVDTGEFLKSGGSVFCMKMMAW